MDSIHENRGNNVTSEVIATYHFKQLGGQCLPLETRNNLESLKIPKSKLEATCKGSPELGLMFNCNEIPPMLSRLTTNPQSVVSQSSRGNFVEFNLLRQK